MPTRNTPDTEERGGHTPKVVTPRPKATTIPKGPAPGARKPDGSSGKK